jgi:type IX secretion system PorP/SprF family membrane protein
MKTQKTLLITILILAWFTRGNAQDVIYSQFYANPLYLNPALAGAKLDQRITLNYRNQWPSISNGYISYSASWDQQFDKISGALGVLVNADIGGGGAYNKFSGSGIYSYRLQATRFIVLNAALQATYMQYTLDWSKLVFGDQFDGFSASLKPTSEDALSKLNVGNMDLSAGILGGYKESLYFGVAVSHLTRPDIAFYDMNQNRLNMRWTVHSGVLIDFDQGMEGEDIRNLSISPNFIYVQQGKFRQLNVGMYLNKFPFVWGLWMRHNFGNPDALIALLGFQTKAYKIGYSYDYTISHLTNKSGGAHEISIAWMFNKLKGSSRYRAIPCPTF